MRSTQSTFEKTLADYFRERLEVSSEELSTPPHEDTLWYMGNMLARFGDKKQLFAWEEGKTGIRPLALLYSDACETDSHNERCLLLRQLGDLALFLGALFPENYARRGINKDYFVGMGGGAYDYLSENAYQYRHVFSELSDMFTRMLEVIAQACTKETVFDASDILGLYQRWRETGDPRVAAQLRSLGVEVPDTDRLH